MKKLLAFGGGFEEETALLENCTPTVITASSATVLSTLAVSPRVVFRAKFRFFLYKKKLGTLFSVRLKMSRAATRTEHVGGLGASLIAFAYISSMA